MIGAAHDPWRIYGDDGSREVSFSRAGRGIEVALAEEWLRVRGFSYGPQEDGNPRGVFWDARQPIAAWSLLPSIARAGLHGVLADGTIRIFVDVPAGARTAIVASVEPQPIVQPHAAPKQGIDAALAVDLAAFGAVAAVLCLAVFIFIAPPSSTPDGKVTLRAEKVAFGKIVEYPRWELRQ